MPDITMCKGDNCPIKSECYRYTATPSEYRQSYFVEPPFKEKMGGTACEHYYPKSEQSVMSFSLVSV